MVYKDEAQLERMNQPFKKSAEGYIGNAAQQPDATLSLPSVSNIAPTSAVLRRIRATTRTFLRAGWRHLMFEALGSPCSVQWLTDQPKALELGEEILGWVAAFEARYSRFISTSLVCQINQAAGKQWVAIDSETERLFAICDEMHFITQGVFDPTALPIIRLWDWKAQPARVPGEREIEAAMKYVGWRKVRRAPGRIFLPEEGMALDLGGIGKEYAVDQIAQAALSLGATSLLIDFGHDVLAYGPAPDNKPAWHIGLEDPLQPGKCWTGLAVQNQAVATSGDYLRNFVQNGHRYGHILDLRSGRPVANGCRSVSVIAPSCTLAGMLSTTVFILGPEEGIRLLDNTYQVGGCITTENNRFSSRRFGDYMTR